MWVKYYLKYIDSPPKLLFTCLFIIYYYLPEILIATLNSNEIKAVIEVYFHFVEVFFVIEHLAISLIYYAHIFFTKLKAVRCIIKLSQ